MDTKTTSVVPRGGAVVLPTLMVVLLLALLVLLCRRRACLRCCRGVVVLAVPCGVADLGGVDSDALRMMRCRSRHLSLGHAGSLHVKGVFAAVERMRSSGM